jgi:hypothetical protein
MQINPVGDIELVSNQWKYKYIYCDDLTIDIPLPWNVEIPGDTINFKVDFGIRINTSITCMVIPCSNLGQLRMSFSPVVMNPGIHRLIIDFDNNTKNSITLITGQHYISVVSLNNESILFKYINP